MKILGRSNVRVAVTALVAGALLGLASLLAVRLLPQPANLLGTLGGPWLATAFAVGTVARRRRPAALAGTASMAAAVVTYYLARKVMSPAAPGGYTVRGEAIPYLVIGLLVGAVMAGLGARWRAGGLRWKVLGPGLLAGALGAEVIVLTTRSWRGSDLFLAFVQGGAAVAAALFLPRSRVARLAALAVGVGSAVLVAAVVLAADLPLRLFR